MADPVKIKLGAINTDHTNRDEAVATPKKLADDITQRLCTDQPAVLTLSEVSPQSLLRHITEQLGTKYTGVCEKLSYDKIVQLWDCGIYERNKDFPVEVSNVGKYMGVSLRHVTLNEEHLHVSVHLPHKKGKGRAFQLLDNYLATTAEKYNSVFIHGDFNERPERLREKLKNLEFAFNDGTATTKKGNACDNIGAWEGEVFTSATVQQDAPYEHHPIYATAKVEP